MSTSQPIQLQPAPLAGENVLPLTEDSAGCCGGGCCSVN